jgi:hypothetical protein
VSAAKVFLNTRYFDRAESTNDVPAAGSAEAGMNRKSPSVSRQ